MQTRRAVVGGLLVAVLLLSVVLTSCTTTATIKVTLKDMAGAGLTGITMTVGAKTATTNASGQATVQGVTPGQVTLKFTGGGYDTQKTETVAKGNNEFTYQLAPAFTFRDFGEIEKYRMRVTAPGLDEPAEAAFVRGVGTHWVMQDGIEIVHLGDVVYFKAGVDESWQKIVGMGGLDSFVDSLLEMTNQFMGELQAFDAHLSDGSIQAEWQRREEVNGYNCDVFAVTWSDDSQSGAYNVCVIAQGDAKGCVTRSQWNTEGVGSSTYDVYDINGEVTVEVPI